MHITQIKHYWSHSLIIMLTNDECEYIEHEYEKYIYIYERCLR